jgi:hypothetical protein
MKIRNIWKRFKCDIYELKRIIKSYNKRKF